MNKILTPQEFIARHYIGSAINAGELALKDPFLKGEDRSSIVSAADDISSRNGKIAMRLVGGSCVHANMGQRYSFVIPGSFVGVGLLDDLKGEQAGKQVLTYDMDPMHPWSRFVVNLAVGSRQLYSKTEKLLRTIEYPFLKTALNFLGHYLSSTDELLTRDEFAVYSRQFAKGIEI